MVSQSKNLPKSTKICIAVIIALMLFARIGGYLGGHHLYESAYYEGHKDGKQEGYDEGYEDAKEIAVNYISSVESYEPIAGTDTYLTTDNAPAGTVWVTPHGEKYHESGCQYINGRHDLLYFSNAEYAEERGYTPCSECH